MNAHEREELLQTLKVRFEKNMHRHRGVAWSGRAEPGSNPIPMR